MTITEALAEIALLKKKIPKKIEATMIYVVRDERERDPLEKSGGSAQHLIEEMQSITDLNRRLIALRRAIARANDDQLVTCGDMIFTVSEWLIWKREVLPFDRARLRALSTQIQVGRNEAKKRGTQVVQEGSDHVGNIIVNIDEKRLIEETEKLEDIAGKLDGMLSLINATKLIEE